MNNYIAIGITLVTFLVLIIIIVIVIKRRRLNKHYPDKKSVLKDNYDRRENGVDWYQRDYVEEEEEERSRRDYEDKQDESNWNRSKRDDDDERDWRNDRLSGDSSTDAPPPKPKKD